MIANPGQVTNDVEEVGHPEVLNVNVQETADEVTSADRQTLIRDLQLSYPEHIPESIHEPFSPEMMFVLFGFSHSHTKDACR